jgi:flagellar motility protein MotE (MotC chaperone)
MKIDFLRKLVETHERIEKALKRVQDLRLRKEYGRLLGLLEFIIELLFSPNFLEMELDCELSKLIEQVEKAEKLEKEQKEELKKSRFKGVSR